MEDGRCRLRCVSKQARVIPNYPYHLFSIADILVLVSSQVPETYQRRRVQLGSIHGGTADVLYEDPSRSQRRRQANRVGLVVSARKKPNSYGWHFQWRWACTRFGKITNRH